MSVTLEHGQGVTTGMLLNDVLPADFRILAHIGQQSSVQVAFDTQHGKARTVQGFHEQPIHFPPTFKYKPGTGQYTWKRVPSWTDRILTATPASALAWQQPAL
jgi:hypothetical protein